MKFVLASVGSRGDVEPFAAVGRELLRRGHEVRMAVPSTMLGLVESAGLAAVPYGPDPDELHAADSIRNFCKPQNPITVMFELMEHINQYWPQMGATLTELADGADLLLTGGSDQGLAANVAEYYEISRAELHFFPGGSQRMDGWIGPITKEAEDAQRRALGLREATGPAPRSLEIQAYDELCFPGLTAQWGEQAERRPFVGALTLELPTDADDEVLSWIAAGTPPIYFGFGSSVRVASGVDTIALISAACAELGERALICSGSSDFTDMPSFDHVKLVEAMNHGAIFPACRAVVHQGGAGTTAAGMRAGVPTLILCLWLDQPIWADVVTQLGVGFGRHFSMTTPETLIADLRSIMSPQCVAAARRIATQLTKPAESVGSTADLLEDTARRGRSG
jgi:vancomycin aglycone glucosyltransferase